MHQDINVKFFVELYNIVIANFLLNEMDIIFIRDPIHIVHNI